MTSPGGQEVGRVSIRVVPDTSKFRRELERELKAIQKAVKLSIPVELDMKGATAQIAKIRRDLGKLSGAKIDLTVDDSASESVAKITASARTLRGALAGASNSVSSITKNFRSMGSSVASSVKNITSLRDRVREIRAAKLDDSSTGRFLKNLSSGNFLDGGQLTRLQRTTQSLSATFRALGTITTKTTKAMARGVGDTDLRFKKLTKTAGLFGKSLTSGLSVLTKGIGAPISMITSGLGGLSRTGMIAVAVLGAIPAILALIAGLLAGLPSLLLAFGAAAGVVALGMEGIKEAWKTFSEGIKPVQQAVSKVFQEGLTPQFREWAKLLNTFTPQLKAIAQSLVTFAQGFTNAITSADGMKNINVLLQNTAKFFTELAKPLETFTGAFIKLGAEGSKSFGLLVEIFQRFATGFKELVDSASSSGRLEAALVGLAKVTDSLLQGFLKLFDVGITAMGALGDPLANALNSIFELIAQLMPILAPFLGLFLQLATTIATALAPAFQALAPLFQQFFGALGTILTPIIQALVPPLQELVKFVLELFQAFSPIFPVLATVAKALGGILMAALNALRPVLPVIGTAMEKLAVVINGALAQATPILEEVAGALGTAIADAINALAPMLPQLIQAFLDLVVALLPLLPPLVRLVGELLPPLIDLYTRIYPPILDMAKAILSWLVPAINWLVNILSDVIGWLGGFAKTVGDAGAGVINWFADLPGNIWRWISGLPGQLYSFGRDLIQGLWNGIVDIWNGLMRWIETNFNNLVNWVGDILGIGSPSKIFKQYGAWLMEGLQIGIDSAAPDALRAAEEAAKSITGIGSSFNSEVTADGTVELMSSNIGTQIEAALSGWTVDINKYGVGKLNQSAVRDNTFGR